MSTIVGNDFSVPVYAEGYPVSTRDEDGNWERQEKFYIQKSLKDNYIPAYGTENGDGLMIRSVEINEGLAGFPDVCEVLLIWGGLDSGASWNGSSNDNETTYESDTARAEKRIEEHPGWEKLAEKDQELLRKYYPNFAVLTVTFRKTQRKRRSRFNFTENEIVGKVGRLDYPDGLRHADPKKWLNYGRSIRFVKGDSVEITESWQYDLYEWQGSLRPDVTMNDIVKWLKKYR